MIDQKENIVYKKDFQPLVFPILIIMTPKTAFLILYRIGLAKTYLLDPAICLSLAKQLTHSRTHYDEDLSNQDVHNDKHHTR